ncbi:uncharacterized protein [Asterias amurensis]|uniref:uncharacterized protein n=1 Tax=Asterias amurensis TaxID=7602 RepID=UPI003AB88312
MYFKTYDGRQDLLLREQFIKGSGKDLALFLKERKPDDIETMTTLAEQYTEAHGGKFDTASHFCQPPDTVTKNENGQPTKDKWTHGASPKQDSSRAADWSSRACHKKGHLEKEIVAGMVIVEPQLHDCCSNDGFVSLACGHSLPIMSATCKVKVKPGMPVKEDEVVSIKVNVLRDSGCSGVVVRHDLVPLQPGPP